MRFESKRKSKKSMNRWFEKDYKSNRRLRKKREARWMMIGMNMKVIDDYDECLIKSKFQSTITLFVFKIVIWLTLLLLICANFQMDSLKKIKHGILNKYMNKHKNKVIKVKLHIFFSFLLAVVHSFIFSFPVFILLIHIYSILVFTQ